MARKFTIEPLEERLAPSWWGWHHLHHHGHSSNQSQLQSQFQSQVQSQAQSSSLSVSIHVTSTGGTTTTMISAVA